MNHPWLLRIAAVRVFHRATIARWRQWWCARVNAAALRPGLSTAACAECDPRTRVGRVSLRPPGRARGRGNSAVEIDPPHEVWCVWHGRHRVVPDHPTCHSSIMPGVFNVAKCSDYGGNSTFLSIETLQKMQRKCSPCTVGWAGSPPGGHVPWPSRQCKE